MVALARSIPAGEIRRRRRARFYSEADYQRKQQLERLGLRVEKVAATQPDGRPDLHEVKHHLAKYEITSVLIERRRNRQLERALVGSSRQTIFVLRPEDSG